MKKQNNNSIVGRLLIKKRWIYLIGFFLLLVVSSLSLLGNSNSFNSKNSKLTPSASVGAGNIRSIMTYDQGSTPLGPTCVAVNSTGYIFASSNDLSNVDFRQIDVFSPSYQSVGNISTIQPVYGIAVNASGYIYALLGSDIQIYGPDLSYYSFISLDSSITWDAITLNSTGYIFVGGTTSNNSSYPLQIYSPAGDFVSNFGLAYNNVSSTNVNDITGIAFAENGSLLVVTSISNSIYNYDQSGNLIGTFTDQNSPIHYGSYFGGIAVNSTGAIYISDTYNNTIIVLDAQGNYLLNFGSSGSGSYNFEFPFGIAIYSDGSIYIADFYNDRIQAYPSDYVPPAPPVLYFPPGYVGESVFTPSGGEIDPQNFAINSSGYIFVCGYNTMNDTLNNIFIYSPTYQLVNQFPCPTSVYNLAINASGYIYVLFSNYIEVYNPNLSYCFNFTLNVIGASWFSIVINPAGQVFVGGDTDAPDLGFYTLQEYASNGNFIQGIGNPTNATMNPDFENTDGISIAPNGDILAVSNDNDTVMRFSADGSYLVTYTDKGSPIQYGDFNGITVNSTGAIYLTDINNNSVIVLDSYGNYLYYFGQYGSNSGQFNFESEFTASIFQNSNNTLFISDYGNWRIQVMYMNYTVTLFPSITLPSQLLYRIIYQNNTYAFWKFANFTFVNSSEFSSIYCIPYQWNFTTQKWTPNTDFQVSQMIVGQTNGISDIWNPETPYNGIFGFNGMTGYAVDLNYSTPQNFIEMPNLVHYLTFNGSALAQMYNIQPGREAALTANGTSSFTSTHSTNSFTITRNFYKTTDDAIANWNLATYGNASLIFQYIQINSQGIMEQYTRRTSGEGNFTMLLDMNLDPSNCNNTYQGLYWGKEVGDTITTQETINGTPYNVEYKITAIDPCNVQTLEISSTMVGHDPVIQTISDAVYADEFIWNDQLQQWTEQPNPASYNPLDAQTSGAYEIGCF